MTFPKRIHRGRSCFVQDAVNISSHSVIGGVAMTKSYSRPCPAAFSVSQILILTLGLLVPILTMTVGTMNVAKGCDPSGPNNFARNAETMSTMETSQGSDSR